MQCNQPLRGRKRKLIQQTYAGYMMNVDPRDDTWSMLMMSLVSDGSDRAPTATVDDMLTSLNLTSVVVIGTPTLRDGEHFGMSRLEGVWA